MPPTPKITASLASRKEGKRAAILEAALTLFALQGFAGTPVPEIANAAGVAAGTIYNYFPSKEALVNELYRQWKGALLASLTTGFPIDGTPRAQFAHLWQALAGFHARAPLAMAFMEQHFHAYLDAASMALEHQVNDFARRFFDAASRAGAVKPIHADLAIALVFGAFVNVSKQLDLGRLPDDPTTRAQAENAMWDAIRQP